MLASSRLVGFVVTTDPERSRAFYEQVLGLQFVAGEPFALVFDSGGNEIRIARRDTLEPQPFTVMGWQVDDVSTTARSLAARGVTFERYPGMGQDDLGIWTPPGTTHGVAWFKDPDGTSSRSPGLYSQLSPPPCLAHRPREHRDTTPPLPRSRERGCGVRAGCPRHQHSSLLPPPSSL